MTDVNSATIAQCLNRIHDILETNSEYGIPGNMPSASLKARLQSVFEEVKFEKNCISSDLHVAHANRIFRMFWDESENSVEQNERKVESIDRLHEIFERQIRLMSRFGLHPDQLQFMALGSREDLALKVVYALIREVVEVGDELPWRWWHKKEEVDLKRVHSELADCLHFVFELAVMFDMTADDLYNSYCEKNDINFERIERKLQERESVRRKPEVKVNVEK